MLVASCGCRRARAYALQPLNNGLYLGGRGRIERTNSPPMRIADLVAPTDEGDEQDDEDEEEEDDDQD